jgi:hypothetical protein
MKESRTVVKHPVNRRSLLKGGLLAGGAATLGAGLLGKGVSTFAQENSASLSKRDIAILRFVAAAELIESDMWVQYAELGGIGDNLPVEVDPKQPMNPYQVAFSNLDGDAGQYITSNTIDEISHATFLNAYLESKGADPVNFDEFRTLQGSKATGAQDLGRLTNLMNLTVDTSWFVRYRSTKNPDFGATFPQAVTIVDKPAIPRTDADFNNANLIQVIANTAAFHFGTIEQGGTSLYAAMTRRAIADETKKITIGIGGDEIAHFLEWVDFAGNGVQAPVAPVSANGVTFPNFFTNPPNPLIQPSLIFPVPCEFISSDLPLCAVIRPISDQFGGAKDAAAAFIAMGIFKGQPNKFFTTLNALADAADA